MHKQRFKNLKLIFLITIGYSTSLTNVLIGQQSTSGPFRPQNVSTGIIKEISGLQGAGIKTIIGVPSYLWYRGCGPTALGMVVGYYDLNGFPDLIDGDASTQTVSVNEAIANELHYNDYSLPLDYYPNLLQDKSELGGAHVSNCIGDFMQTSWSSRQNYWGWSWASDVAPAFSSFINLRNSQYVVVNSYVYYTNPERWNLFRNEIDNNRPVVMLVDSNGDGSTDHFVTGIGYDDDLSLYAIYDTWDNNIHWYQWKDLAAGNTWGIYGFNIFHIVNSTETVTDYDGNVYNTYQIGTQTWMTENLKTTRYNDGATIPIVVDNSEWSNLLTGAFCWYNNNEAGYKNPYGALYNWHAVNSGKLCPTGWHVPDFSEWSTLITYLGGESIAGGKLKEIGTSHWYSPNTGATNESNFTALPGGVRDFRAEGWGFYNLTYNAFFWSSTEYSTTLSRQLFLGFYTSEGTLGSGIKQNGYSVRCIKNVPLPVLTTTSITNLTQNTAQSGGNITSDSGSPITARGVCWSTSNNPTVNLKTKTSDGIGSGSFSSSIIGLSAGTTYYLRAYATNGGGTAYGNEISFKTYNADAITDADGNFYNIITIGSQEWIAENLRTTKFNDATLIANVTDNAAWESLTTPAFCWYNNDQEYKDIYGALYNFYSINTGKLCPSGWLVPTDSEWTTLTDYLGGEEAAGGKLKEPGTNHWQDPNVGATNESGFTALPAGTRYVIGGVFAFINYNEVFWSSTFNYTRSLFSDQISVFRGTFSNMVFGFSVRCIKSVTTESTNLNAGWNIMSFAVQPSDMNMMTIVSPLITGGTLVKVQDEKGSALEQLPPPIGWINNIGLMQVSEGYKIRVTAGTTLSSTGIPVTLPYTIPLNAGWNIMGYPVMTSQNALSAFNPLITAGSLIKVQDEMGNAIEQLPPPIGWIDNIHNLNPGEGYKVRVSINTSLTINSSGSKGDYIYEEPAVTPPAHFRLPYTGNGLDHMNIYIENPTTNGNALKSGDEIGVFDAGLCVGAVTVEDPAVKYFMIRASLDDPTSKERDGFIEGNTFELRLWDNQAGAERKARSTEIAKGYSNRFEKLGTSLLKADFDLMPENILSDAYPNPSTDMTTFTFTLAGETKVRLEIINIMGDVVIILVDETMPGGSHSVQWDNSSQNGARVGAGLYFYRLTVNKFIQTKQVAIK